MNILHRQLAEINQTNWLILVDKPLDWTSFDVVNKLRYKLKHRFGKKIKIGHAGTLDPKATGLLLLCTAAYTKQIETLQGLDKTYTGTMTMGASTPSYDTETTPDAFFPIDTLNAEILREQTQLFTGKISQKPPIFSAIKQDGKKLYEYARKNESVELKARELRIHQFELTAINLPQVAFEVSCSKGTYIRSLVHDFGASLHNAAYLESLRRTRIGDFSVASAWQIPELIDFLDNIPVVLPHEGN